MRCAAILLVLAAPIAAQGVPPQAHSAPPNPLHDSLRLRGTEWDVIPIVRLDSGKPGDSMAVRQILAVFHLAPARVVYVAKLADGGDWTLFSWVDGVTRRLAVHGKEFLEPDGKRKRIYDRFWHVAGPRWFAAATTVEKRMPLPNAVYVTDGSSWHRVLLEGDTVSVSGTSMVIDDFDLRAVEHDGTLLLDLVSKSPKTRGVVRVKDGGFERVVMQGDSLPGVSKFEPYYTLHQTFGMESGLKYFSTHDGYWIAIVRSHEGSRNYIDHVLLQSPGKPPRSILRTEPFSMRNARDSVVFVALSPAGDVLVQRDSSILLVAADGTSRALLGPEQVGHRSFGLFDVTWLEDASSRALLSVALLQSTSSGMTASLLPKLFYYDGSRAVEVRPDTTAPVDRIFTNLRPARVARNIPGYTQGAVVDFATRLGGKGGEWYFDPQRATVVAMPTFRTKAGDIGVDKLVGWNNDHEAVVRLSGGLALLRR